MRNYFTFGQFDSRDFGVYITGTGTYNAPARMYDAISVPGRNGDLLIDNGKFENIRITYPAFIAGDDFNSNLEAFRSALLSVSGYARLADTYHPNEYRMAYFGNDIVVDARTQHDAGEFDITFTCKPQRFLTSGENAIVVSPQGAHGDNLLPYPYINSSFTYKGITATDNGDGTVTLDGICTEQQYWSFSLYDSNTTPGFPILELGKEYILSGCPSGGGSNEYWIVISKGGTPICHDYGSGAKFTYNDATSRYIVNIVVAKNVQLDNVTFTPMIRECTLDNPTLFNSKPIIKATPASSGGTEKVLTIGEQTITVKNIDPYVIINSDIEDCYCGTNNLNSQVSFSNGKYPVLTPGANSVSFDTNDFSSVEITPNWFIL